MMKKTVLAFLSFSLFASASPNIRLEKTDVPQTATLPTISISVLEDGTVQRSTFVRASHLAPKVEVVSKLNRTEMDAIEQAIPQARAGHVVMVPIHALCFRQPEYSAKETADNGAVFLHSGNICTAQRLNDSPAASQLLQTIDQLFNKYARNN